MNLSPSFGEEGLGLGMLEHPQSVLRQQQYISGSPYFYQVSGKCSPETGFIYGVKRNCNKTAPAGFPLGKMSFS